MFPTRAVEQKRAAIRLGDYDAGTRYHRTDTTHGQSWSRRAYGVLERRGVGGGNGCQHLVIISTGDDSVCSDNDVCTGVEKCQVGTGCVLGTPLSCDDAKQCNGAETCDPIAGCKDGTPVVCPPPATSCFVAACSELSSHSGAKAWAVNSSKTPATRSFWRSAPVENLRRICVGKQFSQIQLVPL